MKQKIVIKVTLKCEKCSSKAMKIASASNGVDSVAVDMGKGQVEVVGDGIDTVTLASSLRKKLGTADLVSVAEAKPAEKKPAENKPAQEEKRPVQDAKKLVEPQFFPWQINYPQNPPYYQKYEVVYDGQFPNYEKPANICSIL